MPAVVVSHPRDCKKSRGWGTGRVVRIRRRTTADPSTALIASRSTPLRMTNFLIWRSPGEGDGDGFPAFAGGKVERQEHWFIGITQCCVDEPNSTIRCACI